MLRLLALLVSSTLAMDLMPELKMHEDLRGIKHVVYCNNVVTYSQQEVPGYCKKCGDLIRIAYRDKCTICGEVSVIIVPERDTCNKHSVKKLRRISSSTT
ncbi:hypothetical protein PCASD_04280 [Puccinia coronata f. sp. avenae]|jgi:rRNA maturation protein Nop10|nr:hypothetical protein PCASD_21057 [Puccinia coronata f. sp. avenae]PLW48484.1 hypothetical protein PCASD_04280 [Puccinia coronata f. sp. avenae]